MPNMTLSVDAETYRLIKDHPGINWSQVARDAFQQKARELHLWDRLLSESEVSLDDAVGAGDEAKESILRRLGW